MTDNSNFIDKFIHSNCLALEYKYETLSFFYNSKVIKTFRTYLSSKNLYHLK